MAEVAAERGVPRAQVALAWVLAKQPVTAPIVGATKLQHLEDALAAVGIKLSAEEIASARGALCAARGRRLRRDPQLPDGASATSRGLA